MNAAEAKIFFIGAEKGKDSHLHIFEVYEKILVPRAVDGGDAKDRDGEIVPEAQGCFLGLELALPVRRDRPGRIVLSDRPVR
jgi:hypothetical protein